MTKFHISKDVAVSCLVKDVLYHNYNFCMDAICMIAEVSNLKIQFYDCWYRGSYGNSENVVCVSVGKQSKDLDEAIGRLNCSPSPCFGWACDHLFSKEAFVKMKDAENNICIQEYLLVALVLVDLAIYESGRQTIQYISFDGSEIVTYNPNLKLIIERENLRSAFEVINAPLPCKLFPDSDRNSKIVYDQLVSPPWSQEITFDNAKSVVMDMCQTNCDNLQLNTLQAECDIQMLTTARTFWILFNNEGFPVDNTAGARHVYKMLQSPDQELSYLYLIKAIRADCCGPHSNFFNNETSYDTSGFKSGKRASPPQTSTEIRYTTTRKECRESIILLKKELQRLKDILNTSALDSIDFINLQDEIAEYDEKLKKYKEEWIRDYAANNDKKNDAGKARDGVMINLKRFYGEASKRSTAFVKHLRDSIEHGRMGAKYVSDPSVTIEMAPPPGGK